MNPLTQSKNTTIRPVLIALALGCFALSPRVQAVDPPPDGGYPGQNTAEGEDALFSLTTGLNNTAVGYHALHDNTTGSQNTAYGMRALANTTTGFSNTAIGYVAMGANTTGFFNTAVGFGALADNTTGSSNTATGWDALASNVAGIANTANGINALVFNSSGSDNTATGYNAMWNNFTGSGNVANGADALHFTTSGDQNTAIGESALHQNGAGDDNTGVGFSALFNNTGNQNIALGSRAGEELTTGSDNIDIGNAGIAGESGVIRIGTVGTQTATYIAGIRDARIAHGVAVTVGITDDGQLGVRASSARFKEAIKPMDKASEVIFSLEPVTFHYKKDLDPEAVPQFGLVAEQVAKVDSDLVARDAEGKPYTVRYEEVNAMLLNEFLKEHQAFVEEQRKVQEQGATIARQQEQIDALTAGLQKVSAQLQAGRPGPQVVLNN